MKTELGVVIRTVKAWAANDPLITHVYLFGSRAKGVHRQDSDLDVAVVCSRAPGDSSVFTTGLLEKERWKRELEERLNFRVDLQTALRGDQNVRSYIRDHGVPVYEKIQRL